MSDINSASSIAKIFDGDNKEVKLKYRHCLPKNELSYDPDHAKWGESRRWHKEGFAKKMSALKTKTGYESLLVLKNKDKEGRLTILTTDPVDLNYHNNTSEDASRLSSSILNSTPVPGFTELARASPSKGSKFSAALSSFDEIDEKHCQICYIKFESATDIASDSPWMGCVGQDKCGKWCNYWVDIERLNFYFPEYNKRAKDMRHTVTGKGGRKR